MGSAWKEPMGRVVTLVKGAMLTTIAGNTFLLSNNREPIIINLSSSEQKLELASVYSEVCRGIVESQPDEVLVDVHTHSDDSAYTQPIIVSLAEDDVVDPGVEDILGTGDLARIPHPLGVVPDS